MFYICLVKCITLRYCVVVANFTLKNYRLSLYTTLIDFSTVNFFDIVNSVFRVNSFLKIDLKI